MNARPASRILCAIAALCVASGGAMEAEESIPQTIEFNRDIRPILSDACFKCHGPDEAGVLLDVRVLQQRTGTRPKGGQGRAGVT
jgi:hypothetical protein